jgi:hypothetical protein
MKRKRFSVEQIVGILKQAEVGVPVAEVIRKAGIRPLLFQIRGSADYFGVPDNPGTIAPFASILSANCAAYFPSAFAARS